MKTKILFFLCLLTGLLFINAGLNKFFNYLPPPDNMPAPQVELFTAMMQIGWLFPVVAVAEIVGGILFIIPRFRALGALILFPILVGIVLTNITVAPEGMVLVLIIVAVWLWAVIENRSKLSSLVKA